MFGVKSNNALYLVDMNQLHRVEETSRWMRRHCAIRCRHKRVVKRTDGLIRSVNWDHCPGCVTKTLIGRHYVSVGTVAFRLSKKARKSVRRQSDAKGRPLCCYHDGIAVAITVRATEAGTTRHVERLSRGSIGVQIVCNQKD